MHDRSIGQRCVTNHQCFERCQLGKRVGGPLVHIFLSMRVDQFQRQLFTDSAVILTILPLERQLGEVPGLRTEGKAQMCIFAGTGVGENGARFASDRFEALKLHSEAHRP
jgi:hypothetical protein